MRYLADTHVLLRAANEPTLLSGTAERILGDPENTIFASVVSAYEIATKYKLGKLPEGELAVADYSGWLTSLRFQTLALLARDCITAGLLPMSHKDPWDRLLAAQALNHGMTLLSADTKLDLFSVERVW